MNTEKFLELLVEELELENPLTLASNLKELEEWDSMTAMLLIGVVSNEFGKTLSAEDIKELTTVQSLVDKIGAQQFS
ncbi:acyl carrier protein [Sphingobacterium sp. UDSM-2020]|uniref:acyl carrier protein n=1 Tax=Sphingobacterium sp. UDSM-2020 TaxID=2795738 RepID=UPI001934F78C|nr:acyl carrier protein [Sphingobacterium sp. UDSM-2020]QQD15390.1 acyl carrier protein [Sphingobacterium sp. UDSM-2020]